MMRTLILVGLLLALLGSSSRWDKLAMQPNPDDPPCPPCHPADPKKL